jgi:hypothetical protein
LLLKFREEVVQSRLRTKQAAAEVKVFEKQLKDEARKRTEAEKQLKKVTEKAKEWQTKYEIEVHNTSYLRNTHFS